MSFFSFFKSETPAARSKPPLTEKEVDDAVKHFLTTQNIPNPTNQQIAEILERTVEEVTAIRPIGAKLHSRYDDDDYSKTFQKATSQFSTYDEQKMREMGEANPRTKLYNTLKQRGELFGKKLGGRRTNKNKKKHKKKHKKLSRRRK